MNLAASPATLWEAFQNAAALHAHRTAVRLGSSATTFESLRADAEAVRLRLDAEAVEGPILFPPRNTARSLAFFLGCLGARRVPLLADPVWRGTELQRVIERTGARAIAWEGRAPDGLEPPTPVSTRGDISITACAAPASRAATALLADTAFGRFTSGTTGGARCLQFRDSATIAATTTWCEASGIDREDTVLCLATLNNGLAFNTSLFTSLFSGATLVFHGGVLTRRSIIRTIDRSQPTVLVAFPFVYEQLVSSEEEIPKLARLRLAVSSAAPLSDAAREQFGKRWGPRICNYYGLVEVGPCTFNDGTTAGSLGTPLRGVTLSIAGDDGRDVPAGEAGRVRVLTRSMASAYLDDEEPTFASHLDERGCFVTKDRGALLPGGELVLHGRVDRLVNVAGRKIQPSEVEAVLRRLPGVSDAVVVGEEEHGRTFLAAYVESSCVRREQILEFCAAQMAAYKIPQRVVVLEHLPRSSAGKVAISRVQAEGGRLQ